MSDEVFAVTGATGKIGHRVAHRLAATGAHQRLVVRDPGRAPRLPHTETATVAGYHDADGMRRALTGATTLFLVSGRESADRVAQHTGTVDAAVAAGVRRVVYLSFVGAAPDATFTLARDHWHTEQHIRASGLGFVFLRDNLYHGMLPALAGADGVIRGPAGDGAVAAVGYDDVADAAAAVLRDAGHDGRTYDLTGPAALTLHEVAGELTRVTGRPVRYEPETVEQAYASRASFGAPDFEVAGWVSSYQAIATGELSRVTDAVRQLTGHPAQSFAAFLATHPGSYHHLAPGRRPSV